MASQYDETEQNLDQNDDMESEETEALSVAVTGKVHSAEDYNIASREKLRTELSCQIEAFLARGGKINEIPNHPVSSRPGKPASDFTGSLM
ncbi:hypothetical protein KO507_07005 [Gilvimarinus agarilyticus]|uniref:hypothetical protein n=1 Tax=unclassified Gilvimarinus TaxID=2642066 RepID=UPI001C0A322A|nr:MULTISPECIES: hypothetical protein [unclassified Gilvimarinus]MBU2885506.1 hypothetical protein [Gilvimarinus agarilyticus]MDO6570405.1 hypothetical protein [Gilvimarinus sp. 2_MG-2023]MDO6748413.1 hypothetical protein [Gilvimarinus sp. 1_MG-2023]